MTFTSWLTSSGNTTLPTSITFAFDPATGIITRAAPTDLSILLASDFDEAIIDGCGKLDSLRTEWDERALSGDWLLLIQAQVAFAWLAFARDQLPPMEEKDYDLTDWLKSLAF